MKIRGVSADQTRADLEHVRREVAISAALSGPGSLGEELARAYLAELDNHGDGDDVPSAP